MSSITWICARVERHIPGALRDCEHSLPERFLTGITALDQQLGGIPQSTITQICISEIHKYEKKICDKEKICNKENEVCKRGMTSSGNVAVLFSSMAQLTRGGHFCALVDASDCFDPASAEAVGVDLSRVLWVRVGSKHRLKPLEQAFKAADILVQNGGLGLIAVDLSNIEERQIRRVPLTTWFRFARVVEKKAIALVFLTKYPVAQSCAGLTLVMKPATPQWNAARGVDAHSHGLSLAEMKFEIEIERMRLRKPVQPVRPKFAAVPMWS